MGNPIPMRSSFRLGLPVSGVGAAGGEYPFPSLSPAAYSATAPAASNAANTGYANFFNALGNVLAPLVTAGGTALTARITGTGTAASEQGRVQTPWGRQVPTYIGTVPYVKNAAGQLVPLSTVGTGTGPAGSPAVASQIPWTPLLLVGGGVVLFLALRRR